MVDFRFSLGRLLVIVTVVALLLGMLRSFAADATNFTVSIAGLNFCALCFAAMCWLMRQTSRHLFAHGFLIYGWGVLCIVTGYRDDTSEALRWLLAITGILYCSWVWLAPIPQWLKQAS